VLEVAQTQGVEAARIRQAKEIGDVSIFFESTELTGNIFNETLNKKE